MILSRNKLVTYKAINYKLPTTKPNTIQQNSLLNIYVGYNITPYLLCTFLKYAHIKKGFELPLSCYNKLHFENEAAEILLTFGDDLAMKLIIKAYKVSKHPFSFKFISKLGMEYLGDINDCKRT